MLISHFNIPDFDYLVYRQVHLTFIIPNGAYHIHLQG
jgi:hypothetical protein